MFVCTWNNGFTLSVCWAKVFPPGTRLIPLFMFSAVVTIGGLTESSMAVSMSFSRSWRPLLSPSANHPGPLP